MIPAHVEVGKNKRTVVGNPDLNNLRALTPICTSRFGYIWGYLVCNKKNIIQIIID